LSVTSLVWPDEFQADQALRLGISSFRGAKRLRGIDNLYDPGVIAALARAELGESPAFRRNSVHGYAVLAADDLVVGFVFHTRLDVVDPQLGVWWAVDANGTIRRLVADARAELPDELKVLPGFRPLDVHDCASLADLAALEFAILSRYHSGQA
jgi:hypothetical protein